MASTTSDNGDTSSKQQQAQRKENYDKSKRGPFHQSITAILTEEKREESSLLNLHNYVAVDLAVSRPRSRRDWTLRMTVGPRASTERKEEKQEGKWHWLSNAWNDRQERRNISK